MQEENRPRNGVQTPVISVGELTHALKRIIEGEFKTVAVEGEVLNAKRAHSGHMYFTLKDERANLGCVMWRSVASRLSVDIRDGMKLVAHGDVQVYPPHGKYQLNVTRVKESGLGRLLEALEALKRKLTAEGLFDESRKVPLPLLPRRVGIVTAATGAAIHDIVTTISARYPARMLLFPSKVQGVGAAIQIAHGISILDTHPEVEVIIVGRGGGSLEDLWAFNEEPVARAIAACSTPVVSAVGHDVDVLLSDHVADRRAATPTAAGEMVVPSIQDLRYTLQHHRDRLSRCLEQRITKFRTRLLGLCGRIADPRRWVVEHQQQVDELSMRMEAALRKRVASVREAHSSAAGRLRNLHPRQRVNSARFELLSTRHRLQTNIRTALGQRQQRLEQKRRTLQVLSPVASLERGYAIVRDLNGRVIRSSKDTSTGEDLQVLLHEGLLDVEVLGIQPKNPFE